MARPPMSLRLAGRCRRVAGSRPVEEIFWIAKDAPDTGRWRCPQQNDLARALIGVREELPESRKVVEAATAPVAYGTASQARQEVNRALQQLHAGAAEADAGGPPA